MFVSVLKMMSTMCASSPSLGVQLMRLSECPAPPPLSDPFLIVFMTVFFVACQTWQIP